MPVALIVETHGKAVVVKGDTREVKEFLKSQGGRWNKGLVGWVFQGSKKESLLEALRGSASVGSVEDRTGSAASEASKPAAKREEPTATVRTAESASEAPQAKKAKTDSVDGKASLGQQSADGHEIDITDSIRGTVNDFNGKFPLGVDLRKFYKDKDSGEMRPTAKGIRLSIEEWQALRNAVPDIDAASSASGEKVIKLGEETRVTIGGTLKGIDVRRFYVDRADGEQKPTKKGMLFSKVDWTAFKAAVDRINEAVTGGAGPSKQAKVTEKKSDAAKTAPATTPSVYMPPAATETSSGTSTEDLRKKLTSLLTGRDLTTVSMKIIRGELEVALGMAAGGLDSRREEVKGIVTDLIKAAK